MVTDSYYSLLKFEQPYDDLDLDCLVGKLSPSVKYITVFPVRCDARLANAYFCSCPYFDCFTDNTFKLRKQVIMDQVLLFE